MSAAVGTYEDIVRELVARLNEMTIPMTHNMLSMLCRKLPHIINDVTDVVGNELLC